LHDENVKNWKFSELSLGVVMLASMLSAQSLTTGDIAGVVKDPTGAVVQNATIALKSLDTDPARKARAGPPATTGSGC